MHLFTLVSAICALLSITANAAIRTPEISFVCMALDKFAFQETCADDAEKKREDKRNEQLADLTNPNGRRNISECLYSPCYNITCPAGQKCGTDNIKKVYVYMSDIRNTNSGDTPAYDSHAMIKVNYSFRAAIPNVTGQYPATADVDFSTTGGQLTFDGRKQSVQAGTVVFPEARNEAYEQFLEVTVTADGIYEEQDEEFDIVLHDPVWYKYVYEYTFNSNDGVKTDYESLFQAADDRVRITTSVHAGKLGTLNTTVCSTLPPPDDDDLSECDVTLDLTGETVTILANELRRYKVLLNTDYNSSNVDVFGPGKNTTEAYLRISDPDDSGVLMFSSADYEFPEAQPDGQTSTAILTVTRVGGISGKISVDYESDSFSNTAIAGADYEKLPTRPHGQALDQPASNTLIFDEGETMKEIRVELRSDELFEYVPGVPGKNDEYFLLKLVNSQPMRKNEPDRPRAPLFEQGSYEELITETAPSSTSSAATARVVILDDGDAGILDFTETDYYIREDAEFVTLTITRTKGGKDNPGSGGRSSSCCKEVTINIATAEAASGLNTAVADLDYQSKLTVTNTDNGNKGKGACMISGYVNCWKEVEQKMHWPNNIHNLQVNVPILNDAIYESVDEYVTVSLLNVLGGARLGKYNTTRVHILDDRDAGTFSFKNSSYDVHEDAGLVTVTVVRTGLSNAENTYTSGNVSVDIRTVGEWNSEYIKKGTPNNWENDYGIVENRGCDATSPCIATPGEDYTPTPLTTLLFPEGKASMEFTINITDDNLFEAPDEVFKLELVNPTNGSHIAQDTAHPKPWTSTLFVGHGTLNHTSVYQELEKDLPEQNDKPTTIITILDNSDPSVKISRSSTVSTEGGAVDQYDIVLNSKPTSAVTIELVKSKDDEVFLSTDKLVFDDKKPWNETQIVTVAASDDQEDEPQEKHMIKHLVTSADPAYNGGPRMTVNDSGTVFAMYIFDSDPAGLVDGQSPWTPQISIANQVACPPKVATFCKWCGSNQRPSEAAVQCITSRRAIQTAPASNLVQSFMNDNDHASVQIQSDRTRFKADGSELSVSVRKDGFNSSYSIWLDTLPAATVTVHVYSESPLLSVHPTQLIFLPANSNVKQVVGVSVLPTANLNKTETAHITHSCTSTDPKYNGFGVPINPGPVTVMIYDKVGVTLSKSDVKLHENGVGDNYTAVLRAEPMHAELLDRNAQPFRFSVVAESDTTIDAKRPNDTTLGAFDELLVATPFANKPPHASRDWEPTYTKMSILTFPLYGDDGWPKQAKKGIPSNPSVVQRAAGPRMGTIRLRLYRLKGGENGGALGVSVGASVLNSTSWKESDMSWFCATDECRCSGGQLGASNASAGPGRRLLSISSAVSENWQILGEDESVETSRRRLEDDSSDGSSYGGSYGGSSYSSYATDPTQAPTPSPTISPTFATVKAPHQISFNMGLAGYSASEFDNKTQTALTTALAIKTFFVDPSQIQLENICQKGGTPAGGVSVCPSRRRLLASAVSIQFDVTINVGESTTAQLVMQKAEDIETDPSLATAVVTSFKEELVKVGKTPPSSLSVSVSQVQGEALPTSAPTTSPTSFPTPPTSAPTATPTTFVDYPCMYPSNGTQALKLQREFVPLNAFIHADANHEDMISASSIAVNTTAQFDFANNTYVPKDQGWFELDVTDAVNTAIEKGLDRISFVLFARTTADMILGFTDEVSFASREHADAAKRPHLMMTPSGSCNIALGKTTLHSHASQGNADRAVDGLANVPLTEGWTYYGFDYFSMSYKNSILDSAWWQLDLGDVYSVQKINVYVREEVSAAMMIYSKIDYYVMIGNEALGQGYKRVQGPGKANLDLALAKAIRVKKFSLDRPANSPVGPAHVLRNEWVVGEPLVGNWSQGKIIPTEGQGLSMPVARYVLVQYEGRNFLPITEVEVFQPAMSGVDVTVGAYMPSPSTLSGTSQLAVTPSDACNELKQCRSALTFTSGNWDVPQTIAVSALDDDVASGLRQAVVTHMTGSSDVDYQGSKFFSPRSTVTAQIEDDDSAGVTLSKNSTEVTEGAHTYLGAPVFVRLIEVPVVKVVCSTAPSLKTGNTNVCGSAMDRAGSTWWDTSISLKPLDPPTYLVADMGTVSGAIVQMHIYKPQNIGSRGVAQLSLVHSDTFSAASNPTVTWVAVEGKSTHQIPWGMTSGAINHTIDGFSSKKRYIAVVFDKTFGGHAMGDGLEPSLVTTLEVHELTFTGAIPYTYPTDPSDRGDWDVASTNLSRMHLQAVADEYTIVLDSEPLSDVIVRPVVLDAQQLNAWDKYNSTFNQDYVSDVITGRYHFGFRNTEIATALYFNASTWNIPQTVQISAVDNNIAAPGTRKLSVSHVTDTPVIKHQPVQQVPIGTTHEFNQETLPLMSEYQYKNIDKYHTVNGRNTEWPRGLNFVYTSKTGKISVGVTEDDKVGVSISESHIYVTEAAGNGSFAVMLDSEPTAPVTVHLAVAGNATGDQLQIVVSPDVLVFDRLSWSVPQKVVVAAHNDHSYEGRFPFTRKYTRYIEQPFSERILVSLSSTDADYNRILIGQNEPQGSGLQYVRDQSIEVTVIDDDAGCLNEYKCAVPKGSELELTSESLCVDMDSYHFFPNLIDPNNQSIRDPRTSKVCNCPHGWGMRDCSSQCQKMSLCEFRRIHFIVECSENGICTEAGGLDKAAFVRELARSILLFNARLMESLGWPTGPTSQVFPGQSTPASPYDMADARLQSDTQAADKANSPVTAPTRMPTPSPTIAVPTVPPTLSPTSSPSAPPSSGSSDRRLAYAEDEEVAEAKNHESRSRVGTTGRKLLGLEIDSSQVRDPSDSHATSPSRRLEGTEQKPLTLESAWDVFYVVKALPTQCMFSFKKSCKIVTVDVKDETGELTDFLLQSERAGTYAKYPLFVQFAQQADTLDHSQQLVVIMWTIFGFLSLTFICILTYKVYKAFKTGTKDMTEAEKRAFRESQTVWS